MPHRHDPQKTTAARSQDAQAEVRRTFYEK